LPALLILLLLLQKDMPLPAADAENLLQLAVNCTSRAPIIIAIDRLPSQLEPITAIGRLPSQLSPSSARRLVVTAAVREHVKFEGLDVTELPAVGQHIDAATENILYEIQAAIHQILMRNMVDIISSHDAADVGGWSSDDDKADP
jgi:hypothetical protein